MSITFHCISGCNHCCMARGYLVEHKDMGVHGLPLQPHEIHRIRKLLRKHKVKGSIIPAYGTSEKDGDYPTIVIAYQLLSNDEEGNNCPFLSDGVKEPRHCIIYGDRPLSCKAYPLKPYNGKYNGYTIDENCKWVGSKIPIFAKGAIRNLDYQAVYTLGVENNYIPERHIMWFHATGISKSGDPPAKYGWYRIS